MRRLIMYLYRTVFGLRIDAADIQIGDLERMRDDLLLEQARVASELEWCERRLDRAIEQRLELHRQITQGAS